MVHKDVTFRTTPTRVPQETRFVKNMSGSRGGQRCRRESRGETHFQAGRTTPRLPFRVGGPSRDDCKTRPFKKKYPDRTHNVLQIVPGDRGGWPTVIWGGRYSGGYRRLVGYPVPPVWTRTNSLRRDFVLPLRRKGGARRKKPPFVPKRQGVPDSWKNDSVDEPRNHVGLFFVTPVCVERRHAGLPTLGPDSRLVNVQRLTYPPLADFTTILLSHSVSVSEQKDS